jgi:methylated-DNA-[protein]-cysteine S-methyltransferase
MWYDKVKTPVGSLTLACDDGGLRYVLFERSKYVPAGDTDWKRDAGVPVLREARRQVLEYFGGERRRFDLPLAPVGTPFQLRVWRALRDIPFGATCTYGDIAVRIGAPSAMRAVGAANGRNPLPIVVPCHRVIGRDGRLTGFGGGLPVKQFLLVHEGIGGAGAEEGFRFRAASG